MPGSRLKLDIGSDISIDGRSSSKVYFMLLYKQVNQFRSKDASFIVYSGVIEVSRRKLLQITEKVLSIG